jgi:iron-sulfur cluster repair protein YtfE (RIC family)
MIKNKLSLSLMIFSLVILPNLALAQTAASTTKATAEKKNIIKTEIDARKEAVQNSVREIKQNATDKIKENVSKFVQNIINRYDAATARLEKLADRIDSRIAKIEAKNIDVSKAKELLSLARTKIETAKISVIAINFPDDIASSTAAKASTTIASLKENFKVTKTQMEKAKSDIKAAQAALVDVVNSLKPGDEKLKNATTTAATTTHE